MKNKNLWGSRFEKEMDTLVAEFNASIGFDIEFFRQDIRGSIAHVTMLATQNIVTEKERDLIISGLENIRDRIENGELTFTYKSEDIHMAVEGELIKNIGDVGRKLHTARSRNDQAVTDTKLFLKDKSEEIYELLREFECNILNKAEENIDRIMPGFTHFQHAQPVTIGFHLMSYFQQFRRDMERLKDYYKRLDYNSLGACALAGTTLSIDRHLTAELLNFSNVTENAMDTVSDRDYVMEFVSFAAMCMVHLSRFSEEFIIWNSQEFAFLDIDDSYCTGSSIMPQKKNPDIAELIRGKAGRAIGNLMTILTVVKGTPMSFNKDFQEDKEVVFDTVRTVRDSVEIFSNMLKHSHFRYDNIERQMDKGFLNATDVAESLVQQGIPFRTAHELVGVLVKYCENNGLKLEEIKQEDLPNIDHRLKNIELKDLDNYSCIMRRNSFGGTSPVEVQRQINVGREFLEADFAMNC